MPTMREIDRYARPRSQSGCDWGSARVVLASRGDRELWWRHGFTGWVSLGQQEYQPAQLMLMANADISIHARTVLHEGGRLSRSLFIQNMKQIDEFFECPGLAKRIAECYRTKTVVVEDE